MLPPEQTFTRRRFVSTATALAATALTGAGRRAAAQTAAPASTPSPPLEEFPYAAVHITGPEQLAQRSNVLSILMGLNEDDLLQPLRAMAGRQAPGTSLGGWYAWKPDFDFHHDDVGFAPASTLGQWISALARLHAGSPSLPSAPGTSPGERALRLTAALADSITPAFFANTRFPAYTTDKLVCGLMDTRRLLDDPNAFPALARVIDAAGPSLPGHAISRDTQWKMGADLSWMWDESYTLPENLFLISALGAGDRYRTMAEAYLDNAGTFEPLAQNRNVLSDRHAYSYVNSLCSAMQAFFTQGSTMHLDAARNGFAMVERQSFATGGWGPDELLRKPGYDELAKSLTATHNTFEAPCCGYAHLKLTRYLLRATRDGHYGDSMERVLYNTLLGVLPLQPDGRSFYYADYNQVGRRIYSVHRWPCCSGTLPQVVADYGINTYLRSPGAVWVNLYQPSELRWTEDLASANSAKGWVPRVRTLGLGSEAMGAEDAIADASEPHVIHSARQAAANSRHRPSGKEERGFARSELHLTQETDYPFADTVTLHLTATHPVQQTLHLRIPAWCNSTATLRINSRPEPLIIGNGFAAIHRRWSGSTTLELTLPLALRLESFPANGGPQHPDAIALLVGPVALFAVREPADAASPIDVSESALLNATRTAPREWIVETLKGPRRFVPFTELGDRAYSTYVHLV